MKLKPLPKNITDEIRQILEDCQSGKLEHEQSWFHCGTAHCIAGWKAVLDYSKVKKDQKILSQSFDSGQEVLIEAFVEEIHDTWNEQDYAEIEWKLSYDESQILFGAYATFAEQFDLLERLERGERIE